MMTHRALYREKKYEMVRCGKRSYIRMTLYKYNKIYGDKQCESLPIRNLSCAGNSNSIYNILIFQFVTCMKKTKRSAAKNGKVMNEVANATSKKALVKV